MSWFYIGLVLVVVGFGLACLTKRAAAKLVGAAFAGIGVYVLLTTHPAIAERSTRDHARMQFCKRFAHSVERWDSRRKQKPQTQQHEEWLAMANLLFTAESLCLDNAESCVGLAYDPGTGPFDQELPRRLEALVRGDGCK